MELLTRTARRSILLTHRIRALLLLSRKSGTGDNDNDGRGNGNRKNKRKRNEDVLRLDKQLKLQLTAKGKRASGYHDWHGDVLSVSYHPLLQDCF